MEMVNGAGKKPFLTKYRITKNRRLDPKLGFCWFQLLEMINHHIIVCPSNESGFGGNFLVVEKVS